MQNNFTPSRKHISTIKTKHTWFWFLIPLICSTLNAFAQISISAPGVPYVQDFNGLGNHPTTNTWTNNVTLPGWYAANTDLNDFITNYRGDNDDTGSLYSYGQNASDRALGSLANADTDDIVFGVHFENTTNNTVNSVVISFRVEHWRRTNTSLIGHQRTKISYSIANNLNITPAYLFNDNNFIEVPEAFLISIDTTSAEATLNGNSVSTAVTVTIPVSIPDGSEFFLRFDDDNLIDYSDVSLAVDDLYVTFSDEIIPYITAQSDYMVFPYIDMGIVQDIPEPNASPPYLVPTGGQMDDWQEILESFYTGDIDDVDASDYGYVAVEFKDSFERPYYVLRKTNQSAFFWGTYVRTVNSTNRLVIQSPHAVDDTETGTQGAAVFFISEARGLMLSGISRCAGDENTPACHGTTNVCSGNIQLPFRESDLPHEVNSIYHLATTVLAAQDPSITFVQLHGFAKGINDPDLIISCGTINAQLKSVPDYPVLVRENFLNANPLLNIKLTHVDSYTELGAQTNVQGRYLNLYQQDICASSTEPGTVTNRFLHIEQFLRYRKLPEYYNDVANALTQAINENGYERSIPVGDNETYSEDFNNLFSPDAAHTWGNNIHLRCWYAAHEEVDDLNTIPDGLFSSYGLDNSPSSAGLYAFGDPGEHALGTFTSEFVTNDAAYGILLKNASGVTLYRMDLLYNAEQRRIVPGKTHKVKLSYRISNQIDLSPAGILYGSFTNVPDGDLEGTDDGNGWLEGDDVVTTPIEVTVPIVLNPDEEIFIRFFDNQDAGADEVIALDDFYVTLSSTPPPMPVDWLYFTITKKNGRPVLQWGADKEEECKRYDVLRSDDGKEFESIATIDCKRQALKNQYEYADFTPQWQRNVYYKIAQYDEDGEVTYSPVRVFNSTAASKPSVYYQNGELLVDADKETKLQSVAVMDFMGRMICKDTPAMENNSHYTMTCPLPSNQLLIVQLVFDSHTYVVHMRTGD